MAKYTHQFVEDYDGLIGYGLEREVDEYTLTCYLQMFSDDEHMALIRKRMTDADLEQLFSLLGRLVKTYLAEEEYHRVFLKDE